MTAAQQTDQGAVRKEAEDEGRGHIRPFPAVPVLEPRQTEAEPQGPAESLRSRPRGWRGSARVRST